LPNRHATSCLSSRPNFATSPAFLPALSLHKGARHSSGASAQLLTIIFYPAFLTYKWLVPFSPLPPPPPFSLFAFAADFFTQFLGPSGEPVSVHYGAGTPPPAQPKDIGTTVLVASQVNPPSMRSLYPLSAANPRPARQSGESRDWWPRFRGCKS